MTLWDAFAQSDRADTVVDIREFLEIEQQLSHDFPLQDDSQDVLPFDGYKFDAMFNTSARPQEAQYVQRINRHNFLFITGEEIADLVGRVVPQIVFNDAAEELGVRAQSRLETIVERYTACFDACSPVRIPKP